MLLFVGRLNPIKGLDLLLNAFAQTRASAPEWVLVIAGTGDETFVRELRSQAKRHNIDDALIWTGYVDATQKAAALAAADVFVLPSYSESFGIAAAEALASGLPIVLTENCGLADGVAANGAGVVVPSDAKALADALTRLFGNSELRAQLAARGLEFAARFRSDVFAAACIALYCSIIKPDPRNAS